MPTNLKDQITIRSDIFKYIYQKIEKKILRQVRQVRQVSDSIIETTILDGWNVTTLTRVCCEHHERSTPMILENDRLKVVLYPSTVKHHGKPSLNVCKWNVPSANQEISVDQEIRNEPSTSSKKNELHQKTVTNLNFASWHWIATS